MEKLTKESIQKMLKERGKLPPIESFKTIGEAMEAGYTYEEALFGETLDNIIKSQK